MLPILYAQIAQLVEQRTENPRVTGSIPVLGTELTPEKEFFIFTKQRSPPIASRSSDVRLPVNTGKLLSESFEVLTKASFRRTFARFIQNVARAYGLIRSDSGSGH